MNTSHLEMLPISSLNALEYCPRKFYYQTVQGETLVNEFVLEGTLAHQQVHQPGTHVTAEGEMQITRLYLYSEALRLSGFADVVEVRSGMLVPVEYKRGYEGQWLNDHIQLCAQALCLEERQSGKALMADLQGGGADLQGGGKPSTTPGRGKPSNLRPYSREER